MKTINKLKILQKKISDKHNDSFWYDGVIATSGDLTLIACGDIRFYLNDKDGNYLGMYDSKCRDNFPMLKEDKDLEPMYNNENGFVCDMNNWFEIVNSDNDTVGDIYGNYDDAIDALREMEG
jgi:hypothetical protein